VIAKTGQPHVGAGSPDAELITQSLADPELFGQVFDRHVDAIHAFFIRRLGPAVAEDLTAETFARAFAGRAGFVPVHDSAAPWLYGIATNLVYSSRRGERRQLGAYARVDAQASLPADGFEAADARVDAARLAPRITSALLKLAVGDRDVLLLFAWEQLSYAEIATALDIPLGTVASRINRSRRLLRAALVLPDAPQPPEL